MPGKRKAPENGNGGASGSGGGGGGGGGEAFGSPIRSAASAEVFERSLHRHLATRPDLETIPEDDAAAGGVGGPLLAPLAPAPNGRAAAAEDPSGLSVQSAKRRALQYPVDPPPHRATDPGASPSTADGRHNPQSQQRPWWSRRLPENTAPSQVGVGLLEKVHWLKFAPSWVRL